MSKVCRLACSPDADDLFMVRALLERLIDTKGWSFEITTSPTDALNAIASGADAPEVVAFSIAHWPKIADRYLLLPHGGSMGEGYGPVVVAREPRTLESLKGCKVAVPGLTTTACTVLRMMLDFEPVVVPISPWRRTFEVLASGDVEAALLIHEGRLIYDRFGAHLVSDIGVWWAETTGSLPLPLGGNAIRRDLGDAAIAELSELLREGIRHGLAHRDEAIAWLLGQGGALDTPALVDRYLGLYANQRTLDYGDEGRRGIERFLEEAAARGLIERRAPEFSV